MAPYPCVAQIADERDNMPLPVPEDESVSSEEFNVWKHLPANGST
jgi:hypothetical protein